MAKLAPPPSDAQVEIVESVLRIGRFTSPVRSDNVGEGACLIIVPKDAPLSFWLRLLNQYTPDEIANAGLSDGVKEAMKSKNALIEKAAKLLAPLGVGKAALGEAIEQHLKTSPW